MNMHECRFYYVSGHNDVNQSLFLVAAHTEDEAHAKLAKARTDLRDIKVTPVNNLHQGIYLDSIEPWYGG